MFVGFFTSRILLNQLGVVDFGVYNVVGSIIVLLGFLNSTLSLSTQRFINYELGNKNFDRLRLVYSTSIIIHCSLAFVVFILAETIGLWFLNNEMNIPQERIMAANYVYQFSILSAMLSLTMLPHTATIIAHEHMSQYATIGIIDILLRFSVACLLIYVNIDKLIVYAFAMFLVVLTNYLIYFFYCKKNFPECSFFFPKDKKLYKEMLSFSGWNIFSSISIILNGQVVGIILNIFFGPVINAARGITAQVNGAIGGFVSNFQIAVNPRIIQNYASKQYVSFLKLINQSAKFSFFLLLILVVPVWINIDEILNIWLGTVPQYTNIFCRVVLISSLINTFSLPLATAANATGKIKKFQLSCGVFELLNIPVSYILLKLGSSPVSVYFVSLSIVILTLFIRIVILRFLINLKVKDFVINVVLKNMCIAVSSLLISTLVKEFIVSIPYSFVTIIVTSSFALLITLFLVTIIGLNTEERSIIFNAIKRKLKIK